MIQNGKNFIVCTYFLLKQVDGLIIDETENLYLEREARKWATEVAKMSKLAENISKQMTDCQNNTNQQLKVWLKVIYILPLPP